MEPYEFFIELMKRYIEVEDKLAESKESANYWYSEYEKLERERCDSTTNEAQVL